MERILKKNRILNRRKIEEKDSKRLKKEAKEKLKELENIHTEENEKVGIQMLNKGS